MTVPPGPVAIPADAVAERVAELAADVSDRHPDGVVLLAVLPEAGMLADDLAAAMSVPAAVEAIHVTAFGDGGARARLLRSGREPLDGRDALLVTTIVDTGLRLAFALEALRASQPRTLDVLTLLDRPDRRIADVPLAHVGFTVPDCLFAGCGLGREPELMALRDLHYRDLASAERARRGRLQIA